MATTIITKNGSGAPTTDDLSTGELAIDLTNKRLYSYDGTSVIELGVNTASSLDVTGTVTADGLTVDGDGAFNQTDTGTYSSTSPSADLIISRKNTSNVSGQTAGIRFDVTGWSGSTTGGAFIEALQADGNASSADLVFGTRNAGTYGERVRITNDGNVGIGTSPSSELHVKGADETQVYIEAPAGSNSGIRLLEDGTNKWTIGNDQSNDGLFFYDFTATAERLRIDSSGNVGIGTQSPVSPLTTSIGAGSAGSLNNQIAMTHSGASNSYHIKTIRATANDEPAGLAFVENTTERMRIDSSGNVGIGVVPGVKLHVEGDTDSNVMIVNNIGTAPNYIFDVRDDGVVKFRVDPSGNVGIGTDSPGRNLEIAGTGTDVGLNITKNTVGTVRFAYDSTGPYILDEDSNPFRVYTGGSERIRIDSTGRVGIGRTPSISSSKLEVGGADNVSLINVEASGVTGGMGIGSTGLQFFHGSSAKMRIDSSGRLLVSETTNIGTRFVIEAGNSGSGEGALIGLLTTGRSGSGYPIVGYNCEPTTTALTYNRHSNDYASWVDFLTGQVRTFTTTAVGTGTTTGTAGPYVAGGGTSWTSSSDQRFKDNVQGITYGLDAVKSLNPVSYVRNDRDTGETELGFIAQEVESVVQEVVNVDPDGYYGLNYERLIPVLTKAIQEQQDLIESLTARIAALEGAN